jgi:putative ABC transport system substrate-binding protein
MVGKWLELLREAAPGVTRVAVISNPDTAFAPAFDREIEAARALGVAVALASVHDDVGINEAIAAVGRKPGGALVVVPDSFNVTHRDAIIAAATRYSLPLIGWEIPKTGG